MYLAVIIALSTPEPSPLSTPKQCVSYQFKDKNVEHKLMFSYEKPPVSASSPMGPIWRQAYDNGDVILHIYPCTNHEVRAIQYTPTPTPTPTPS